MRTAERQFLLATLAATLAVPGALLALAPYGEARESLGTLCGWGAALLIMLPSWALLARAARSDDAQAFLKAFLAGSLLRLVLSVVLVATFALQVQAAPIRAFLTAFLLGYFGLTAVELRLTLRRPSARRGAERAA